MKATRCVSFDVFDTCLVRRVIAPSEVFRLLGEQLAARLAEPDAADFANNFVAWRMEAYHRARRKSLHGEVTLAETWAALRPMLPPGPAAEWDGMAAELALESVLIGAVPSTQRRVAECRARGQRIIFISDTPLPGEFLRNCLAQHGFWQAGDGIYVSSEERLTKRTGRLFRQVLSAEKITAHELLHYGDNRLGDYEAPRRLGIAAEHYVETQPQSFERLLVKHRPRGDRRWTEIAGKLRWQRLQTGRARTGEPAEVLVQEFLGPFLCLWANWVLQQAKQDGVQRLYFTSRDTRLLWSAARRLAERRGLAVDCRYLYISRQAIFLPSANGPTPEEMPWLERPSIEASTLPTALAKLELTYDEVAPLWLARKPNWQPDQVLSLSNEWRQLWSLLQTPEVRERITQTIQRRRTAALSYFSRVGLLDPVPSAIIDLGWFLTIQRALNRICQPARNGAPIRGYYFGLRQRRCGIGEAGPASAVFYQPPGDQALVREGKRVILLDHLVGLADHPSVAGYRDNGVVEFQTKSGGLPKEFFGEIESALHNYIDLAADDLRGFAADNLATDSLLSHLCNTFFAEPPASCLGALHQLQISSDQNNLHSKKLIEPYNWKDIAHACLPERLTRHWTKPAARYWPEASLLMTTPAKRFMHRCIQAAQQNNSGPDSV